MLFPPTLYVVTVTHGTGHGDQTSVALVTKSPEKALDLAQGIDRMAYEFHTPEDHGVKISKIKLGEVYDHLPGDPSRHHGEHTNAECIVYWRGLYRDRSGDDKPTVSWQERFYNDWELPEGRP
jgi:hypothetical protein